MPLVHISPGDATGQPINGGLAVLDNGVILANGTPDKFLYVLDSETGSIVTKTRLPFAGSAPPMVFVDEEGKTFAVITATGGNFHGYSRGPHIQIYEIVEETTSILN